MLQVDDLVNEQDAIAWLGLSKKTVLNNVYNGKLDGVFIVNKLNHRMYYKSKLAGLRD